MLYFIQGTEQYFIQKEIEKIYAKQKVTPENSIHLSAAETTFETLQMEVCTADLFGDIKGMIVNNSLPEIEFSIIASAFFTL